MNGAGRVANKRARRGAGRDKRGLNVEFDGALVDESGGEGTEKLGEDRKSTRLNSSHMPKSRMPSSA